MGGEGSLGRLGLRKITPIHPSQVQGVTVPVSAQTDPGFAYTPVENPVAEPDELGPLTQLVGGGDKAEWQGKGFNTIWRPHPLAEGGQDRFLELNLTSEKLV